MKKLFYLLLLASALSSPTLAVRTFYIDATGGSNSNLGTSTGAAWKSHPYMRSVSGCSGSGSAPTYTHQNGDRFIFKGGESWPAACFQMNVVAGGASVGARD